MDWIGHCRPHGTCVLKIRMTWKGWMTEDDKLVLCKNLLVRRGRCGVKISIGGGSFILPPRMKI